MENIIISAKLIIEKVVIYYYIDFNFISIHCADSFNATHCVQDHKTFNRFVYTPPQRIPQLQLTRFSWDLHIIDLMFFNHSTVLL